MRKKAQVFFSALFGACIGILCITKHAKKRIQSIQDVSDKHLTLYLMLYQWIKLKQDGNSIASYLNRNEYNKIAIYGMSYVAELLIRELSKSNIQVVYGLDRKITGSFWGVDIYSTDESLPKVDAVIVTAVTFFDDIEKQLAPKVDCPIISLEDIILFSGNENVY